MDLNIDYKQVDDVSKAVLREGEEFASLLRSINTTNEALKGAWAGSDATKYTAAVEAQAKTMQQLLETINEIGAFLHQVSAAYEEACSNNSAAIN